MPLIDINTDALVSILQYLDFRQLCLLRQVCKILHFVLNNPIAWRFSTLSIDFPEQIPTSSSIQYAHRLVLNESDETSYRDVVKHVKLVAELPFLTELVCAEWNRYLHNILKGQGQAIAWRKNLKRLCCPGLDIFAANFGAIFPNLSHLEVNSLGCFDVEDLDIQCRFPNLTSLHLGKILLHGSGHSYAQPIKLSNITDFRIDKLRCPIDGPNLTSLHCDCVYTPINVNIPICPLPLLKHLHFPFFYSSEWENLARLQLQSLESLSIDITDDMAANSQSIFSCIAQMNSLLKFKLK